MFPPAQPDTERRSVASPSTRRVLMKLARPDHAAHCYVPCKTRSFRDSGAWCFPPGLAGHLASISRLAVNPADADELGRCPHVHLGP